MKQLIHEMSSLFARGESFVLATVITRDGSAPRSAGAKMLIRADGSTAGTVGGGLLEAQVEQLSRQVLKTHAAVVQGFQFNGKDAATMDALCGGQVEVLVEWLEARDLQLEGIVQGLQAAVTQHRQTWLVTALPLPGVTRRHALVYPDGSVTGFLPPELRPETVVETRQPTLVEASQQRWMVEPLDISGSVYIFGAGHVSRSLAEFTQAVGFWTVVLDDRPEYANCQRFPTADQIIVLDSFANALAQIELDRDSFIVIVTRGHLYDRTVLTQALKTGAGYIGMIGSRRKIELIYQELHKEGYSPEILRQRVHAPIGLPIAAETPAEIGISIVAEMIKVRAAIRG
jgi:xanthine dehydrogenase accessory factor